MRPISNFCYAVRSLHVNIFSGYWSVAVRAYYKHVRMVILRKNRILSRQVSHLSWWSTKDVEGEA